MNDLKNVWYNNFGNYFKLFGIFPTFLKWFQIDSKVIGKFPKFLEMIRNYLNFSNFFGNYFTWFQIIWNRFQIIWNRFQIFWNLLDIISKWFQCIWKVSKILTKYFGIMVMLDDAKYRVFHLKFWDFKWL